MEKFIRSFALPYSRNIHALLKTLVKQLIWRDIHSDIYFATKQFYCNVDNRQLMTNAFIWFISIDVKSFQLTCPTWSLSPYSLDCEINVHWMLNIILWNILTYFDVVSYSSLIRLSINKIFLIPFICDVYILSLI